MFTLIGGLYIDSEWSFHLVRQTQTQTVAKEIVLKRRWLFFSVVAFYMVVRTTHFITDRWLHFIMFFFSSFCLSMPSVVWKLSVFVGSVCVVIILLLSFDSGCKCNYWYHLCRAVCVYLCNGSMREYVCPCVKEKKSVFFSSKFQIDRRTGCLLKKHKLITQLRTFNDLNYWM